MKTVKQTMLVVLGLLFFALQGCSHDDYIPVPGEPGADGKDGVTGTASCESCHSVAHKEPIYKSYDLSSHGKASTMARGIGATTTFSDGSVNSGSAQFCATCHISEGFIDKAKYGKTYAGGYANGSKISCQTCHGTSHRSFNFAVDGNDFGLRVLTAPSYYAGLPGSTLDASLTGKMNSANTCLSCHQVRPSDGLSTFFKIPDVNLGEKDFEGKPVINNTPTGLTYKYWSARQLNKAWNGYPASTTNYRTYYNADTQRAPGAHDGPQGDIWPGKSGIAIAGSPTTLPDSKNTASHYSKGVTCVSCHMDKPKADGTHGNHSMEVSYVSCTACHKDAEAMVTTLNTFTDAEMMKLVTALSKYPQYYKVTIGATLDKCTVVLNLATDDTGAAWPVSLANGPLVDPSKPTITLTSWSVGKTVPLKYAQAFWNYKFLVGRTGSHNAVHNPAYFKALIQNSIEALK
jgi:hypothetical protein